MIVWYLDKLDDSPASVDPEHPTTVYVIPDAAQVGDMLAVVHRDNLYTVTLAEPPVYPWVGFIDYDDSGSAAPVRWSLAPRVSDIPNPPDPPTAGPFAPAAHVDRRDGFVLDEVVEPPAPEITGGRRRRHRARGHQCEFPQHAGAHRG